MPKALRQRVDVSPTSARRPPRRARTAALPALILAVGLGTCARFAASQDLSAPPPASALSPALSPPLLYSPLSPTSAASPAEPSPPVPPATVSAVPPLRLSVDGKLAVTSNGGLDPSGQERSDVIASVRPAIVATHHGVDLSFDLKAAVTLLGYANGTQSNSALPDLAGNMKSTLVEHWLYFDADAYLRYAEADPFGVRADDLIGANRRVQRSVSLAPYVQHELGPNARFVARQQFVSTSDDAGDGTRLDSNISLLRLERDPKPLGAAVEWTRLDNRAQDDGASRYTLGTARARATAIVAEDLQVGAVVGQDRSSYLLGRNIDSLYGGSVQWTPTPRTDLRLEWEHRYFGSSGGLTLSHRTPFMAFDVEVSRQPVDSASSFGTLGPGSDLRGFLDAILTTRYPDPATRANVVDNLISSRGLDLHGTGAVNVEGDYPQLRTSGRASLAFLGPINTASLALYSVTSRALTRDGDALTGLNTAVADNRQRGGSLQINHRLQSDLTCALLASWSRYEGLGAHAGETSSEQNYRVSLTQTLSAQSVLSVALQWNRFVSTATGQNSFDATLALIGLSHRF